MNVAGRNIASRDEPKAPIVTSRSSGATTNDQSNRLEERDSIENKKEGDYKASARRRGGCRLALSVG